MTSNKSLTKHKGTSRSDQGGQLGRHHGCHDQYDDDQNDDHENLERDASSRGQLRPGRSVNVRFETHVVESSNGSIEIPHRSFQSEFFTVNLNGGHVKLVPGSITILVSVEHGKSDFGRLFIGEESSDITEQYDVASFPSERVK